MEMLLGYLALLLAWVGNNPASVLMMVGAVASLTKNWLLVKWPALGKLAELAAHVGVNLTGIQQSLVSGVPVVLPKVVAAAEKAVVAAEVAAAPKL